MGAGGGGGAALYCPRSEGNDRDHVERARGGQGPRDSEGRTIGRAGFSYDLFFDEETDETIDETFESHGIKLFIDMMSFTYLEGTEIDYVEGLYGAGFKFNNPNAKTTCGCGSSFGV